MDQTFNKATAIFLMKQGHKITHRWFSDNEWMTMKGTMIILEDGVQVSVDEFFNYRTDSSWEQDYSLYKD